jgi:glycerophosphoryl diester phosphodiesterase
MASNPWRRARRPLSIAHRGHCTELPENTRLAYEQAIRYGVEMIECDVHLTRDGQLVMLHDSTLDRTTSGAGRVAEATWDEIQRLDAGAWFGAAFAGQRVPSTDETLRLFREAGIQGCFEVKGDSDAEASRVALALADLLVRHDALGFAVMSSYSHAALRLAKQRVPELVLAPERLPDDQPADPPEAVRQARALEAGILQHHYALMTPELVRALHDHDIALWAWPTTSAESVAQSVALGADAVMGDDVRTMMAVLDRMCPAEAAGGGA